MAITLTAKAIRAVKRAFGGLIISRVEGAEAVTNVRLMSIYGIIVGGVPLLVRVIQKEVPATQARAMGINVDATTATKLVRVKHHEAFEAIIPQAALTRVTGLEVASYMKRLDGTLDARLASRLEAEGLDWEGVASNVPV
jgi:hypothetical protein